MVGYVRIGEIGNACSFITHDSACFIRGIIGSTHCDIGKPVTVIVQTISSLSTITLREAGCPIMHQAKIGLFADFNGSQREAAFEGLMVR
jgi:hypothetical protein